MTSYNWGYLNSSNTTPLGTDGDLLKDRVDIQYTPTEDTEYDTYLQLACQEATRAIDNALLYYTAIIAASDTTPPTNSRNPAFWKLDTAGVSNCPLIIKDICADLATKIYKRRMFVQETHIKTTSVPPMMGEKTEEAADYWSAEALGKLNRFIESNYKKPHFHIISDDGSTAQGYLGGYTETV
jgi:hypothetical protein